MCYNNMQCFERITNMKHNTENLEHFSASQSPEEKPEFHERPFSHRVISWVLIGVVLFAFLGTCYWLAFYGRS